MTATSNNNEVFECANEEEMVSYMTNLNLLRQQQSIDTPFMTSPLDDIFVYLVNDKVAKEVLDGTFIAPESTLKYVLEFLDTLKIPDAIRELGPVDVTTSWVENSMR